MKKNKTTNVRVLAQLGLLAAIEIVMKLIGLGSVPVGPLYMSFLTVPIAVGAMTMGPVAGAILGGVFGLVSFKDALTGGSAMTSALFQVSPVNTFILCVAMRILMGWFVGLLFSLLRRVDKKGGWSYLRARCPRRCSIRCSLWGISCWCSITANISKILWRRMARQIR